MKKFVNMENFVVNEEGYLPAKKLNKEGLKALDSEVRLEILELAYRENLTVSKIIDRLDLDDQTAYYHVQLLEKAGILEATGGNPKVYSLGQEAFFFKIDAFSFVDGPVNPRMVPDVVEDFFLDGGFVGKIVVEDSSPDYFPEYRYKVSEIAGKLGEYGSVREPVLTAKEAERTGFEGPKIIVGRPENNKLVERFCETSEIEIGDGINYRGENYSASRTGAVVKSGEEFLITGNSDLGVSTAIKSFVQNLNELEKGVIVQGFGDPRHIDSFDVLKQI